MASSWLDSWGQSWGDAWGPVVQVPGAMRGQAHGTSTALGIITVAHLDVASVGGTPDRKKKRRPGWVYNPQPVIEPRRTQVEEAEALLLCDAL